MAAAGDDDRPENVTAIAQHHDEREPRPFLLHRIPDATYGSIVDTWREDYPYATRLDRDSYEHDKRLLQVELLKLPYWVNETSGRIVVLFEGRDAVGTGGTIKRFTAAVAWYPPQPSTGACSWSPAADCSASAQQSPPESRHRLAAREPRVRRNHEHHRGWPDRPHIARVIAACHHAGRRRSRARRS